MRDSVSVSEKYKDLDFDILDNVTAYEQVSENAVDCFFSRNPWIRREWPAREFIKANWLKVNQEGGKLYWLEEILHVRFQIRH